MIISYIELNQCFFHLTVSHTPNLSEIDVYEEVKGMLVYFVNHFRNDGVLILNHSLKFEMGTKEREKVILYHECSRGKITTRKVNDKRRAVPTGQQHYVFPGFLRSRSKSTCILGI